MGKKKKAESTSEPYGEPAKYDPTFRGPIKNRSCTDILCCVLFMVFIVGYMIVGILAWLYGDPREVIYPRNSTGLYCGIGTNEDKPYVFYFDILKCASPTGILASALNGLQCPTTQVCVSQCPNKFWLPVTSFVSGISPSIVFEQEYCNPSIDLTTTTLTPQDILLKELCPKYTIPSTPFLGRCVPKIGGVFPANFTLNDVDDANETAEEVKTAVGDLLGSFNAREVGMRIFEDFTKSWYWILIGLVIAMLVSLLFMVLLRFLAGILVWIMIIALVVVIGYGIWHSYWEYDSLNKQGATIASIGFTTDIRVYGQVKETWLAVLIILAVLEVIILLLLIFLRKRILIAIALIKEASKAIGHIMSSLLYPLVTFVLLLICVAYWGLTALYLATSGQPLYRVVNLGQSTPSCDAIPGNETCDPLSFNASKYNCEGVKCAFYKYNDEGILQRNLFNLQIYNIVGFLWCMNFVLALGQCTLAGAFASYYWAFKKPADIPYFAVSSSFMRSLRYHTGSLAFGALILTIVQLIRIILEYLDHKLKHYHNPFTKFLLCCLKCCFWCLEKFIKFINRNAYIMIAVYGKNFCVSAKNAFKLLMRNVVRVVVLDKITDLLLLFGKLLVVGGVGVLAFFFFTGRIKIPNPTFQVPTLNYYWVPILTLVVGSYMIAHGFFSVYNMCVDTLFLCFLEDLERNDGSAEKPYYMPSSLMKILNKKNKPVKSKEKK
ncbi:choline transporter-like protein 4 [Chiloscyllium plagiosum]|uniref:choline transporter-like protein 4 n=1 Tax=Chiloscyllium plagiosum TaxID=36176 RepID=UPI001CB86B97|nr:choline transporter-like protein 4 [Chiloscyllium plagiosum]XP_043534110.1 choline transporter-like protein 4 [Chiloscyllium plagiosum]